MRRRSRLQRWLAGWAPGALLAALLVLPVCDLHFDCGCRLPGLGGSSHCDIHTAGPPDCPWCAQPARWAAGVVLSFALGLLGAWITADHRSLPVVALTAFVVTGAGMLGHGLLTSLLSGRPVLAGL